MAGMPKKIPANAEREIRENFQPKKECPMKNLTSKTFAPVLAALIVSSCGVKEDDKDANSESSNVGSLLASDSEAATQSISSQVDAGASAVAESNDSSSAALALTGSDAKAEMTRYRVCEEKDKNAVVTIKRSSERSRSKENKNVKVEMSHTSFSEKVRTFSLEGGEVNCAENGKRADIDEGGVNGLKLDVTINEQRAKSMSMTNIKKGTTKSHSFKSSHEGTRSVKFLDKSVANGVITITKETSQSMNRTLELTKKDGSVLSIASTVKTADDAPLKVIVKRQEADKALVSRTVESGTLTATNKDGSKVETKFINVMYLASSTEKCVPVSGSIEGAIYEKDATAASKTYTITFSEEGSLIKYSDGTELDYDPSGCELDEPEEKATEKTSKDDVAAPTGVAPKAAEA